MLNKKISAIKAMGSYDSELEPCISSPYPLTAVKEAIAKHKSAFSAVDFKKLEEYIATSAVQAQEAPINKPTDTGRWYVDSIKNVEWQSTFLGQWVDEPPPENLPVQISVYANYPEGHHYRITCAMCGWIVPKNTFPGTGFKFPEHSRLGDGHVCAGSGLRIGEAATNCIDCGILVYGELSNGGKTIGIQYHLRGHENPCERSGRNQNFFLGNHPVECHD